MRKSDLFILRLTVRVDSQPLWTDLIEEEQPGSGH